MIKFQLQFKLPVFKQKTAFYVYTLHSVSILGKIYDGGLLFAYSLAASCSGLTTLLLLAPILVVVILLIPVVPITIAISLLIVSRLAV